ncbi:MAG TPA: tetratricopeptide repeat protein [Candidatus Methanoperedens sp.]|nr:tetratricopeptide repeat protein [Candidatus Methanoperedens sp.]
MSAATLKSPRFLVIALLLVLAVAAIYGQTYRHGFIAYDDDSYIYDVREVTGGLTLNGLRWAFGYHAGNWHPLTWLSHMLDVQLFGVRPGRHHLVGAGLHALNAVLLAGVLTAATGAFWRSVAVAALFALHPLRVESVAWASERKDVLSSLFGLLSLWAYVGYARRPGIGRYLAAAGCFVLGLMAKPMRVTLPFVLLLLDWWPLGRLYRPAAPVARKAGAEPQRPWLRPLLEKIPLVALTLAASIKTMQAQTTGVLPIVHPDLLMRVKNAAYSYWAYLGTFFWPFPPVHLAFLYPYPREGISLATAVAAAAMLVVVTALVVWHARRLPFLATGWFWYVGTLVPVIGLVQVGGQARSDRYTYLTTTGFAIALVWLVDRYWPRRPLARRALAALFLVALVGLGWAAWAYTGRWKNSLTLFKYTVDVTKDNYLVMNNYGTSLMQAARIDEAIGVLQETTRIDPKHCNGHYNLGIALLKKNRHREAVAPLERSLQCYVDEGRVGMYIADTHFNLGVALAGIVQYTEAERHLRAALQISPNYPGASAALGDVLFRTGRMPGRNPAGSR